MSTQLNFAKDQTTKWGRNLGNGAAALATAVEAIHHVRQHGDTTVLAKMMERAKERGDTKAASDLSFMIRQVWEKARVGKDKNGHAVIKIKGCDISNTALPKFDALVSEGVSIRGPKMRAAFKSDDDKTTVTPKIAAERFAKRHTKKEVLAMIAALQAQAKAM